MAMPCTPNLANPPSAGMLSFTLLAERVVGMLEETFRFAAEAATTPSPVESPLGQALPATRARRLERLFRGLLALPCVFPIPAGCIDGGLSKGVVGWFETPVAAGEGDVGRRTVGLGWEFGILDDAAEG
ncbi:hypothetical protein ETB97_004177 [Aspergillus alliaceus]|uniref:Uncharacterized protein n=1 Tax=Petromyces alliaceus TaxID=209559 RepID=A0A8H6EAF9_PETAA|nr:hypothetical protein ETB97_004177 [Aspergillus burnettii]